MHIPKPAFKYHRGAGSHAPSHSFCLPASANHSPWTKVGHAPDTGPPFAGIALVSIQGFINKRAFLRVQAQGQPPILQVHAQAPASLVTEVAIRGSSERRTYFDKSPTVVNVCLSILRMPCH